MTGWPTELLPWVGGPSVPSGQTGHLSVSVRDGHATPPYKIHSDGGLSWAPVHGWVMRNASAAQAELLCCPNWHAVLPVGVKQAKGN